MMPRNFVFSITGTVKEKLRVRAQLTLQKCMQTVLEVKSMHWCRLSEIVY